MESDHGDHGGHTGEPEKEIQFSLWGQIFGYLCAVLYLASRIPQILLNYRRKSCEGVSILFFMFAGMGNLTYVMSILAYVPEGDWDPKKYRMHLAVNASWLLGSVGTLILDAVIFGQFFMYQNAEEEEDCESDFGDDEDLEGNQQNGLL